MASLDHFERWCSRLTLDNGRPFVLEDFQREILADHFSGAAETLILIPKKSGKSTLVAAVALHHLVTTADAECVVAASSRDQAELILRQARGFIRRSPGLQRRVTMTRREINSRSDEGRIRVLASDVDTADGVLPTLAIVDELHRARSAELYSIFADGLGPRGGRMLTITTAGTDPESPLGVVRRKALAYPGLERDGAYVKATSPGGDFVMHEWALAPDDDREDMHVVKRANPATWQTPEALRRRFASPAMTPSRWARFACGVWLRDEDAAISQREWGACARPGADIPRGEPVRIGLDLGWRWDTTAIVPHQLREDGTAVIGVPRIIVPPRDGTALPKERIIGPLLEMRERWDVREIVMDPEASGEQLAQDLEAEGFEVVAHSQKAGPMSTAAERVYAAVRERKLEHPDDEELNAHVLAAARKSTEAERWRFVKPKSRAVIDGVIATAMVHSVAVEDAHAGDEFIFEVFS